MKEDKQHLNIDLEFLDKKDSQKTKKIPDDVGSNTGHVAAAGSAPVSSTNHEYNWKNILIIGGIILFFGWAIFSDKTDNESPSSINSTSSNSTFTNGSGQIFRCSDYNYDQAMALKPSDSESAALDTRINSSDIEKSQVENIYVDEYDQISIDQYNEAVDSYNLKNNRLKSDLAAWDTKISTYNNYLDAHCTPK